MKRDLLRLAPWLGAAVGLSVVLAAGLLPECGGQAPAFTAPLVSGPDRGDRITRDGLVGEIVVLDFWASWCPPCVESIPVLNELAEAYQGRVVFYGVNVEGDPAEVVGEAHQALGARFPTLHDPQGEMQAAFAVDALPTLFILDREGHIRHRESGVPDASDISDALDELILSSDHRR